MLDCEPKSGCSAVGLAYLLGVQGVGGSNPPSPIFFCPRRKDLHNSDWLPSWIGTPRGTLTGRERSKPCGFGNPTLCTRSLQETTARSGISPTTDATGGDTRSRPEKPTRPRRRLLLWTCSNVTHDRSPFLLKSSLAPFSKRGMLVKHIHAQFGKMKLEQITRPAIEAWLVDLPP